MLHEAIALMNIKSTLWLVDDRTPPQEHGKLAELPFIINYL